MKRVIARFVKSYHFSWLPPWGKLSAKLTDEGLFLTTTAT